MIDAVGGFAAVEGRIRDVLGDERAARIVARFFAETAGRAAEWLDDGTVFLVTGDIPAMWLRDSAAQVMPFLRLDDAVVSLVVV